MDNESKLYWDTIEYYSNRSDGIKQKFYPSEILKHYILFQCAQAPSQLASQ